MQKTIISNFNQKSNVKRFRNKSKGYDNQKIILSNIKVNSLLLEIPKIEQHLPSLFKGIKSKYKDVVQLDVENNAKSIFLNLEKFLNEKFDVYKIDFLENNEIVIYKELKFQYQTLWFLEFENLFKLKRKAPQLYAILLNTLQKFNFITNNFMIGIEEIVTDEITELSLVDKSNKYYDADYINSLKRELKGYKKMTKEMGKKYDITQFENYKPKNKLYQEIIELIKNTNLNFNLINNLDMPISDWEDKENALRFNELFGYVFNVEVIYKNYIESQIDAVYQEYDIIPPLDCMVIKNGKIKKDFKFQENELTTICAFFENLINLIEHI